MIDLSCSTSNAEDALSVRTPSTFDRSCFLSPLLFQIMSLMFILPTGFEFGAEGGGAPGVTGVDLDIGMP